MSNSSLKRINDGYIIRKHEKRNGNGRRLPNSESERRKYHEETKIERNPLHSVCGVFLCLHEFVCKDGGRFAGMAEMLFPESGGRIYCNRDAYKKERTHCHSEGKLFTAGTALHRRNFGYPLQFLCHRTDEHCGCVYVKQAVAVFLHLPVLCL